MGVEIIALAVLVMVLNILDSTTTAICFKLYPDKELKGEANPFLRSLMLKNKWSAEGLKHGVILGIVIWCIIGRELVSLRIMGIILGLVVLNNTYAIISRAITHREGISPIRKLQDKLHIPDKGVYLLAILILLGLTSLLYVVFFGIE